MSGCVLPPIFPITTGSEINPKALERIKIGKTTKYEVFSLLGPPRAIAVVGEPLHIREPRRWGWRSKPIKGVVKEENYKDFFSIVSNKKTELDSYRVYYYYHSESRRMTVFLGLKSTGLHTFFSINELWLLVNEKTGLVENMFYLYVD